MNNTAKLIAVATLASAVQAWWPFGTATVADADLEPVGAEIFEEEIETEVIDVEPVMDMTRETVQETAQKTTKSIKKSKDSPKECMIENKFATSNFKYTEIFDGFNTCEFKHSINKTSLLALENQIKEIGGQLNKVTVKEVGPGNSGVFATGDIKEGDIVMFIPREMIITLEEAEHSPTFEKLVKKNVLQRLGLPQSDLMFKLFLMEERRNPESTWTNYLQTTPRDWSTFPPQMSNEDALMFDGSFFIRSVVDFKKAMASEYDTISKKLKDFGKTYAYQEFMETFLLKSSRSMTLNIHSEQVSIQAIVPYADFINHSSTPNVEWEYSEDDKMLGLVIKATQDIPQGEQLFAVYGQDKSNEQLLRAYGFIDPTHMWTGENIKMKLKMSEDVPFAEQKKEMLEDT